jgi:hypothetical protein
MDMNFLESVKRIIDYLYPHEKRSFEEFISGEYKSLNEHIFYDIDKIKNWFDSQNA